MSMKTNMPSSNHNCDGDIGDVGVSLVEAVEKNKNHCS